MVSCNTSIYPVPNQCEIIYSKIHWYVTTRVTVFVDMQEKDCLYNIIRYTRRSQLQLCLVIPPLFQINASTKSAKPIDCRC